MEVKKNVTLNITPDEFSAISRLKLAIRKFGAKTVAGGSVVQFDLAEQGFSFGKGQLDIMVKLKEPDSLPRNIGLHMTWDCYCALSNIVEALKRHPKNTKAINLCLENWELTEINGMSN